VKIEKEATLERAICLVAKMRLTINPLLVELGDDDPSLRDRCRKIQKEAEDLLQRYFLELETEQIEKRRKSNQPQS
jgi:hypothetical protein